MVIQRLISKMHADRWLQSIKTEMQMRSAHARAQQDDAEHHHQPALKLEGAEHVFSLPDQVHEVCSLSQLYIKFSLKYTVGGYSIWS